MSTESTENASRNPWLTRVPIAAAIVLFVGIVMTGQPYPDRLQETFGPLLVQLGGVMLAGWLVACAICWQIAHAANRE